MTINEKEMKTSPTYRVALIATHNIKIEHVCHCDLLRIFIAMGGPQVHAKPLPNPVMKKLPGPAEPLPTYQEPDRLGTRESYNQYTGLRRVVVTAALWHARVPHLYGSTVIRSMPDLGPEQPNRSDSDSEGYRPNVTPK